MKLIATSSHIGKAARLQLNSGKKQHASKSKVGEMRVLTASVPPRSRAIVAVAVATSSYEDVWSIGQCQHTLHPEDSRSAPGASGGGAVFRPRPL